MSRTKKQKEFAPPGFRQAIRSRFLQFAFRYNDKALLLLATGVREGRITARRWAADFGMNGTWIEQWAEDTLQLFRQQPPDLSNKWVMYAQPRAGATPADAFSFSIPGCVPVSRWFHEETIGGSLGADDDWERFEKEKRQELDRALKIYRERALQSGGSTEVAIPDQLELKLQVAALSVFCSKGIRELSKYPAVRRDPTVVARWLTEILGLLELPNKPAGRKKRLATARNPRTPA